MWVPRPSILDHDEPQLDHSGSLAEAPRELAGFLLPPGGQAVAPSTCAAQMGLFVALGGSECLLLAAMALDRYLAICRPLYYP